MKPIDANDLEVGQLVAMIRAPKSAPGLADRLFKVMAIDLPHAVLRTGESVAATSHMINLADAEFALPERDTIAALSRDFILDAEVVGDE